jgi:hypothetical protein
LDIAQREKFSTEKLFWTCQNQFGPVRQKIILIFTLKLKFHHRYCHNHRQKLAEHLGLKMEQLPLLATLKGNDFLNYKDLIHFHRNLVQAKNGKYLHLNNVFPKLADFIRRQGVDMDLKEFARKVLRNENKASIMQVKYCSLCFHTTTKIKFKDTVA